MNPLPTRTVIQGVLLLGQILLNYTSVFSGKQKQQLNTGLGAVQMALLVDGYVREVDNQITGKGGVAGLVSASKGNYINLGKGMYHG